MPLEMLPIDHQNADAIAEAARVLRVSYGAEAQLFSLTPETGASHPAFTTDRALASMLQSPKLSASGLFLDGTMIGLFLLRYLPERQMEVVRLCVMPWHRGKGRGASMLEHIEDRARAAGCGVIIANVPLENAELMAWWERRGYPMRRTIKFGNMPYTMGFVEKVL